MPEKGNIFAGVPARLDEELIEVLATGRRCRLERIVSRGHRSPDDTWYNQEWDEWVILLSGAATLRFADDTSLIPLQPGDYLFIPAHRRHRVESTADGEDSVWLALHLEPAS